MYLSRTPMILVSGKLRSVFPCDKPDLSSCFQSEKISFHSCRCVLFLMIAVKLNNFYPVHSASRRELSSSVFPSCGSARGPGLIVNNNIPNCDSYEPLLQGRRLRNKMIFVLQSWGHTSGIQRSYEHHKLAWICPRYGPYAGKVDGMGWERWRCDTVRS
jgi:hypothetical protein